MKTLCCKLHAWSFGLSLGILWGLCIFLMGLFAMGGGWGTSFVETMSEIYLGYTATFMGSIIGALWGFVDMFIGGVLIALLYNFFLGRFGCKGEEDIGVEKKL